MVERSDRINRKELIESKKERLKLYRQKEAYMLSPDGVRSYGTNYRNVQRYDLDLTAIQKMISELEEDISELEGLETGQKMRKAMGVVPRDW